MPYFPFFANIENMPCLVVGGGQVALRKIEKLLDFSPIIKVVALEACGEIKKLAKRGMIILFERASSSLPLLQRGTCALAFQQAEKALPLLLT